MQMNLLFWISSIHHNLYSSYWSLINPYHECLLSTFSLKLVFQPKMVATLYLPPLGHSTHSFSCNSFSRTSHTSTSSFLSLFYSITSWNLVISVTFPPSPFVSKSAIFHLTLPFCRQHVILVAQQMLVSSFLSVLS